MRHLEARLAAAAPWLVGALIAGEIGWLRMTEPALCGLHRGQGHCAACYAAAILLLIGLAMALGRPQRAAAVAATLLLAACADRPPPPASVLLQPIPLGERIAQRECGQCHALRIGQASPLADAPSFPALRARHSRDDMAVILEGRIAEMHPRMPTPRMDIDEIVYFLDYWDSAPRR